MQHSSKGDMIGNIQVMAEDFWESSLIFRLKTSPPAAVISPAYFLGAFRAQPYLSLYSAAIHPL